LDQLDLQAIASASRSDLEEMAASGGKPGTKQAELPAKMDKAKEEQFAKAFAENLNKAKATPEPAGVVVLDDGTIQGFADPNKNGVKDGSEKELFRVYLDEKRARLVASDTARGYNRERPCGFSASGLLTGYLIGSMLNRQRTSNFDTGKLASLPMAPAGYHGQAVKAGGGAPPGAAPGAGKVGAPAPAPGGAAGKPAPAPSAPTASAGVAPARPAASPPPPAPTSSGSARSSAGSKGFSGGK
jgi:hypothetical protein